MSYKKVAPGIGALVLSNNGSTLVSASWPTENLPPFVSCPPPISCILYCSYPRCPNECDPFHPCISPLLCSGVGRLHMYINVHCVCVLTLLPYSFFLALFLWSLRLPSLLKQPARQAIHALTKWCLKPTRGMRRVVGCSTSSQSASTISTPPPSLVQLRLR